MLRENFEELVKHKARRMAGEQQQAIDLGFSNANELKAFKVGGWDAMIYEWVYLSHKLMRNGNTVNN